ncbi:hypothetical protein PIB30_105061, partial [Stylosanthes scabra]|nr:hypothetical protein [Stylosanthes scabra]
MFVFFLSIHSWSQRDASQDVFSLRFPESEVKSTGSSDVARAPRFAVAVSLSCCEARESGRVVRTKRAMAFFDITLFHKGYFGYEDSRMKYMGGEKLIVQEQDNDFWSVFEAEEQLRRLGNRVEDIAALWYKDPEVEQLEVGLTQFANDRDVINMVNLGLARGSVELYVVYEGYDDEGIPEIG